VALGLGFQQLWVLTVITNVVSVCSIVRSVRAVVKVGQKRSNRLAFCKGFSSYGRVGVAYGG